MDRDLRTSSLGLPDGEFWRGRRVLVTGHTGFKGSWLVCWLLEMGADLLGVALPGLPSHPSLWGQLDLSGFREVRADLLGEDWAGTVEAFSPEVVLHLAAQPLVSVGFAEPATTYEVNVLGTVRLLDKLSRLEGVLAVLVVTTDKVYDTTQRPPYDERHALGGHDPYATSKAAVELIVRGWPRTSMRLATARAGNVVGGGDWAKDRLLPDLVRTWGRSQMPKLRRPEAVRPWQHVLEPLRGYLLYVEAMATGQDVSPSLNFGPREGQSVSVAELVAFATAEWRRLASPLLQDGWAGDASASFEETPILTLNSTLSLEQLGWVNCLSWQESVTLALDWYAGVQAGQAVHGLMTQQLHRYLGAVAAHL